MTFIKTIPKEEAQSPLKEQIFMRIDSCRNCGSELKVIELCRDCGQPLHYQCEYCRNFVTDSIHLHGKIIFS